jgi:metallo-beta-lactamase family protein
VVVSHAHLDHTGNLPSLVGRGYRGAIHVTPATADLARVMLPDSAFLMQREVEHVNRHAKSRPPRAPLYTMGAVDETLTRLAPHGYHEPWPLEDAVTVTYYDAGHILGSALSTLEFKNGGRSFRLGMSGDLGRPDRRILRDPEHHPGVDALVLESTYGDRLHSDAADTGAPAGGDRDAHRGARRAAAGAGLRGGAHPGAGRLAPRADRAGRVPDLPIFVDSPMARETTGVFRRHFECFDPETRRAFEEQDGAPFGFPRLRYVGSADESRALNDRRDPCIIISASGMCEGGRILHHLKHGLGDARNTVLFVGYQAEGTLGRRLKDGADTVSVLGEPIIRRPRSLRSTGFSAHADQREILDWASALAPRPASIFLVHGEIGPMEALAAALRKRLGIDVHIPTLGQEFELWN